MSPLTTKDLKRIFEKLDKNGDGHVSLDELSWLLERIGVQFSLTELESLVGKPSLNFDEFLFFYESISSPGHSNNNGDDQEDGINDTEEVDGDEDELSDLVKAFKVFDQNDDGFISCEELQSVLIRLGLMEENSGKDCKTMINAFDSNLDGQLDFEEFKNMMLLTRS
ncbi:Parvalbumin [Trema orientale]|uniref:Parvalbumin n=1 Tax=Trema orientale TaxID=63057 RepID=A0A2P5F1A5_TREOI|nr:Parvalbumin [Trema orientale]